MGMDIYGIKPFKLTADRIEPLRPQDEAPQEEWNVYLKARDEYRKEADPGRYFRASLWAWRPIQVLCAVVNAGLTVKLPSMEKWGQNSGAGLSTQQQCNKLANGLDLVIGQFEQDGVGKIYLDVSGFDVDPKIKTKGMYIKYKGVDGTSLATESTEFLTDDDLEKYKEGIKFIQKQGLCVRTPYLIEDPEDEYVLIEPAHSIYIPHIREFVRFLRNCGGFEIW